MVKKEKEMNPKQKIDQGKCANPNATTISTVIIKQLCAACELLPQFMNKSNCLNLAYSYFNFML